MNIPAAVIAAMALCNQHAVANIHGESFGYGGSLQFDCRVVGGCLTPSKADQQKAADDDTSSRFRYGYAWEPEFQAKCAKIHDYITHLDDEATRKDVVAATAKRAAEKAAIQPTLDKGVAALSGIRP